MIRQRHTGLLADLAGLAGLVGFVSLAGVGIASLASAAIIAIIAIIVFAVVASNIASNIASIVTSVVSVVVVAIATLVRGHSVQVRRTRSSGLSGRLGWLRVPPGSNVRHLLQACTSVDRLVDYLLDRAVDKLPEASSARFAEEWGDHRKHYSGWRLVWWALCVRATAIRTVAALGPARLPRDG